MDERALLERALSGQRPAIEELVAYLAPVVLARVGRVLRRRTERGGDVEDLGQEVFGTLFASDARVLRAWDPDRGLSLANFVGLIAEREASAFLRSGRRSAWNESPIELEEMEGLAGSSDEDHALEARDVLAQIVVELREQLSPRGLELFQALVVETRSVEEVAGTHGMSHDAIYQWKSRLLGLARRIGKRVVSETGGAASTPRGEQK